MDLGEDEDFAFKHPYFFENFTFKFVGLNLKAQRHFENVVKSMGAKILDDAEYTLTDNLHASSDLKNFYSISYLLDSIEAETPLEIEEYKFANLIQGISQSKFCCLNAKYLWKNQSCLSYYNKNICCKSCMRIRGLHCDELSEESNNLSFNQINEETNRINIDDLNKELQCVNNGDLNKELQCENTADMNKESQCANIGALNEQIYNLQVNENFDNFAMYDNFDDDFDDVAGQSQINGVSQENGASKNNSDSSDIEIVEVHVNKDLEEPSCSTQKSEASKAHKNATINKGKRARKISSNSDTSSKNEDSCNSTKRPKTSKTNKPFTIDRWKKKKSSTIDRWKKKRVISSDSEASDKSEESEKPTRPLRKQKSKQQRLSSSPSPEIETVTNKSSSDFEFIPSPEASSSTSSSNEEQDFVIKTNSNKKTWWLELPPPDTTKRTIAIRKREYDYIEKRIMLTYLIVNDLIYYGTSRKPWDKMLKQGYLTDRTVESLNNHFRKTLLPNIESFKLPKKIEDQFIVCRKHHIGRK